MFNRVERFFGRFQRAGQDQRGRQTRTPRRLQIENLENRQLMTATPAAPTFSATAVSPTQINLAWNAVSGATGYVVEQYNNGAWKQVGNFSSGTTHDSITGLNPQTTYYFEVGAYNSAGTKLANFQSCTTLQAPPAAPTFTLSVYSATQINLSWSTVAGATSYVVDEYISGAWKQVGNFANGGSTQMPGMNPSTTYYFEVGAKNAAGTTFASYKSVTTPANLTATEPVAATNYSAVSGSLFGSGGPSYLDVQQGAEGDCWLLASLAEVAARDPADIKNMFTSAGSTIEAGQVVNFYNVRFYNSSGIARNFLVDTRLPSGGAEYAHLGNGTEWVGLAEKAYAEANGAGWVQSNHTKTNSYDALNGGDPKWALQAITGHAASDVAANPTSIAQAWNKGELIVLSSSSKAVSPYIVGDSTGTHAYAVVNYTASSSMPFEMYNPWGTNSSGWALGKFEGRQVYGLFNCNGTFLTQNFAGASYGTAAEPGMNNSTLGVSHDGIDAAFSAGTAAANHPARAVAVDQMFAAYEAQPLHSDVLRELHA